MNRGLAVSLLAFCAFGWAAEPADPPAERKKIETTIQALYLPNVRNDSARMGKLLTEDFEGDLSSLPTNRIWSENFPPENGFRITALKFITADVALVDGETKLLPNPGGMPVGATWDGSALKTPEVAAPRWSMVLRKDGDNWRIAVYRLVEPPPAWANRRN
jgi:hypothetical protein